MAPPSGATPARAPARRSAATNRATALFNAANVARDAGDVPGALALLAAGLNATGADARRALLSPANHHPPDGEADADRLRGPPFIATNSLAVLHDFTATDPSEAAAALAALGMRAPWGGPEAPPTPEEAHPLRRPRGPLHLLVQVYEPADPARRAELVFALMRNLMNPLFSTVHCLLEDGADADFAVAAARALGNRRKPDLVLSNATRRLRFGDAFDYANRRLAGDVVVLANADVFFEAAEIARLGDPATLDLDGRVLALLRWEWACPLPIAATAAEAAAIALAADGRGDACARLRPRADSQDAWVFRAPLANLPRIDVELGRAKCDNHVAALLEGAGYSLSSPIALGPRHVQGVAGAAGRAPAGIRSYTGPEEIRGATRYVPLDDGWLF